ncbi:MAG: CPXCG motif-containing cysteine-rich protein [Chromatiales bacterium]|jgi:hypothetical protein
MNPLDTVRISCPYCGEPLDLAVDCSVQRQRYVEDCQVCCSPMDLQVTVGEDGRIEVEARRENE